MSGPSYPSAHEYRRKTHEARPRKAVVIALVVAWLSAGLLLYSEVEKIQKTPLTGTAVLASPSAGSR